MGTFAAGIIDTAWEIIDTVWECIICAITNSIIWIKVNVTLMYYVIIPCAFLIHQQPDYATDYAHVKPRGEGTRRQGGQFRPDRYTHVVLFSH